MSRTTTILKGTFILSLTGFITRFMGFFYRIFLSQTLGEAGVGLYQLIFPVYALGFSLTSAGTEIALSRLTANYTASGNKTRVKELLHSGILFTLILSLVFTLLLQKHADFIANSYLHNQSAAELLLILSYVFPLSAVHSCIIGYYLGLKQTRIPSISQIIEQCFRIFGVFIIYKLSYIYHFPFSISFAVLGLVIGECVSCLFCVKMMAKSPHSLIQTSFTPVIFLRNIMELVHLSFPLTTSRVMLNLLQSVEAVSIPLSLEAYGASSSEALSIYGVFTGMALPCILFPSAITNAVSTMLLPTVSEVHAIKDQHLLINILKKTLISCIILGSVCCFLFLSFGNLAGKLLFNSTLAGKFIITLAWMCPFLYTNNTLISIINGIGKTWISFFINTICLAVRIISVIIFIPVYGIYGYLTGLLCSQILVFFLCLIFIFKILRAEVN